MSPYTKNGKRMYNLEYSVGGVKHTSHDADDFDRLEQGRVGKMEQVKPIKRALNDNEKFFKQIEAEYEALDKHKTYIKVWIKYKLSNWEHIVNDEGFKVLVGEERVHTKDDFAVILSQGALSEEKLQQGAKEAQDALANKLETMAGDYFEANVIDRSYSITTLAEINKNTKDPMYIKMQKTKPIQYMFMDGVVANKPDTPGYCVIEYLMKKYGKTPGKREEERDKIASLNVPLLKQLLNWKEDDKGVCTWDLQEFCDKYKISHYALDITKKLYWKKLQTGSKCRPALIYYMADGHIHPIEDKNVRNSIIKCNAERENKSGFTNSSLLGAQLDESDTKVAERIERFKMPYHVDVQVSQLHEYANCNIFYHTLNLYEIVEDIFFQDGISPKFYFQGAQVVEIEYKNNVKLFRNCNHKVIRKDGTGLDWEDSMRMCEKFKIPFKNQSLTSLACDVYKQMFNNYGSVRLARKRLSSLEKEMIFAQQKGLCNHCKKNPIEEMDHIVPVSAGGSSEDFENWQGLCKEPCHNRKTALENAERVFHIDNSISSYNATTKPIFLAPKSALVHHFKDKDTVKNNKGVRTFGLDTTKCRKNAVLNNKFDYPVYSALDDVKEFSKDLHGDIPIGEYYVKTDNLIPFKGNGWYNYVMVRYAIENGIITQDNITHTMLPSLHVRADAFNKFINHVYATAQDDEIAKFMINSWIGTLGTKVSERRSLHFTRSPTEASYLYSKNPKHTRVEQKVYMRGENVGTIPEPFIEVWTIEQIMMNDSYAPVYNQILAMEAVELHKITEILKAHGGEIVYVNTDNAVAQFPVDKYPEEALIKIASKTFWDDNKKVIKYKIESELKSRSKNMQTISTEEYVLRRPVWNETPDPGHNNFKAIAKEKVDSAKGIELGGSPGVGKTTLARAMIAEMFEQGKKVLLLAPTNKACRVLHKDAVTIHSIFNSKGDKCSIYKQMDKYDYIVIDEKSMIHEIFWRLFLDIKYNTKCLFVIIGDWTQLPPVNDRATFDYRNSSVINILCDNNRMNLTICRRSDPTLFNLYMQDDLLANVDTKAYGNEICERSLTYRNSKRKEINNYWMEMKISELEEDQYYVEKKNEGLDQSQLMYVYVGLPVMSLVTNKTMRIANGETFVVQEIGEQNITIGNEAIKIQMPRKLVNQYLVPAYCLTVHKSQGETFDYPYSIVGWKEMDQTLRYVALSRGTKIENLNFY
jgi:hypothetical protein